MVKLIRPLEDSVVRPVNVVTSKEPRETIRESDWCPVVNHCKGWTFWTKWACVASRTWCFALCWFILYSSLMRSSVDSIVLCATNFSQQNKFILTSKHEKWVQTLGFFVVGCSDQPMQSRRQGLWCYFRQYPWYKCYFGSSLRDLRPVYNL